MNLRPEISRKISRYFIEQRHNSSITYNELAEITIESLLKKLNIPEYNLTIGEDLEVLNEIHAIITEKGLDLKEIFIDYAKEADKISYDSLDKINTNYNIGLSRKQIDAMAIIMYRISKDTNKLPYDVLFEELNKLKKSSDNEQEQQNEAIESESKEEKQEKESINLNEDQMIEIAQKCFGQIAEKMTEKGLTLAALFGDKIISKKIEGEEVNCVSSDEFVNGLKKLGIEDLESMEYTCLLKILSANDEENNIRITELEQILEQCADSKKNVVELNFEELDNISMVIMLALSEFLIRSNASIEDLFAEKIKQQKIKEGDETIEVDYITNKEFFAILKEIGIEIEESEHDILKKFLSINEKFKEKISLDKLRATLEEFASNEELRKQAHKYYQELNEEQENDEGPQEKEIFSSEKKQQEKSSSGSKSKSSKSNKKYTFIIFILLKGINN